MCNSFRQLYDITCHKGTIRVDKLFINLSIKVVIIRIQTPALLLLQQLQKGLVAPFTRP